MNAFKNYEFIMSLVSSLFYCQVTEQGVQRDSIASFEFRSKFYPEDVSQLVMEVTLHFFYMQVSVVIIIYMYMYVYMYLYVVNYNVHTCTYMCTCTHVIIICR